MATFTDGNVLTAAQMEAVIDPPYGQMALSSDQSFSTTVSIAPMAADILNGFTVASNNLVVPSDGVYAVGFSARVDSTGGLSVEFDLLHNASILGAYRFILAGAVSKTLSGAWIVSCAASDTFGLSATPGGGSVVAKAGATVTAHRIAST
jgi:hypothetical protein